MTDTRTDSREVKPARDFALIGLLAAVTAIGPFAMHALAPALPWVATEFSVSSAAAQLMLSLSLVAMALANLVWGPVSDRFGRRPILIAGLVLGVAGSAIAALAPVLWLAVLGRLIQAAGAAAGMVLARAIAQDIYGPGRAAGVIGQITGVMVAAPMIAPTVAGLVIEGAGWRSVFWMSALLCAALVFWTQRSLTETAPTGTTSTSPMDMIKGFAIIARRRNFWRFAGFSAFSLSGFYFFVAIAPYVMRDAFGQGAAAYGFYFMLLSGTYMFTNFIAGRVMNRFGGERVMMFGAFLALAGPVIVAALLLSGIQHPLVLFLPGMVQSFGAGLATPNSMAGAVAAAPDRAGAASGLLGFSQFIVASISTQIAGFLPHGNAIVVPLGMGLCLGTAVLFLVLLRPSRA